MKQYYQLAKAPPDGETPKDWLAGEVKRAEGYWTPVWSQDRTRAYKFHSINDIRRWRDILLDPGHGPYQAYVVKHYPAQSTAGEEGE